MPDQTVDLKNELQKLKKISAELSQLIRNIEEVTKTSYRDVPGVMGTFDGENMITQEGEKIPVPPNYAAKSMLVYGDELKMVEEGDRKIFKQVSKVRRKRAEGVMTKKDGVWYALTDAGAYKISATAADYRELKVNDKVAVLVPENDPQADYGALDRKLIGGMSEKKSGGNDASEETPKAKEKSAEKKEEKKEEKPAAKVEKPAPEKEKKEVSKPKTKSKSKSSAKKSPAKTQEDTTPKSDEKNKEATSSLLEDDDLV